MLSGKTVLLTAGPTWEPLDPVRGLTNRSSGKMGYMLAAAAVKSGAEVILVSGPTCLKAPVNTKLISVETAEEMYAAVHQHVATADVFIAVAAVADYRPAKVVDQKIKKNADRMTIELIKNPDILASVGALSQNRPFTVGFAAETQDVAHYARGKLQRKNLDMIAANDVSIKGLGFGSNRNRLLLITQDQTIDLGTADKSVLAEQLLTHIAQRLPQ